MGHLNELKWMTVTHGYIRTSGAMYQVLSDLGKSLQMCM
jgi:hypothetical protein